MDVLLLVELTVIWVNPEQMMLSCSRYTRTLVTVSILKLFLQQPPIRMVEPRCVRYVGGKIDDLNVPS